MLSLKNVVALGKQRVEKVCNVNNMEDVYHLISILVIKHNSDNNEMVSFSISITRRKPLQAEEK